MTDDTASARKQVMQKFFDKMITGGELDAANDIFAHDFVWPEFDLHGPDGARTWVANLRTAFPDVDDRVIHQAVEGDIVFTQVRLLATHKGPFRGIPPTGRRVDFTAVAVDRFRGDKVVEHTALYDVVGLMAQLGEEKLPIPGSS